MPSVNKVFILGASDVIQKPALPTLTFRSLRSLLPPPPSEKVKTVKERKKQSGTVLHALVALLRLPRLT